MVALQFNTMDISEKYNNAFVQVFGAKPEELNDNFGKDTVSKWDSVHQLGLVINLEDAFDILFDPEDIIEFTSFAKGKEILKKYKVEL